jgi:predicted nucleotidyltransferase
VEVWRNREETDAEFEKRKLSVEKMKEQSRKWRYEEYLKLKKEFEPNL